MKKKKYKFTIITPIYQVEEYLRETIESVINQTIGFENNVQLILVNDGSLDNSESICLEYKEKYPENIAYIKQENGGVTKARNHGMKYMEGKFVNFLDSDDLLESNALEVVENFFLENEDIDVIATPLEYFDGKTGMNHPLNWKFKEDRVVDLWEEPNYVQMSNASCFIRREAIDIEFDEKLKYAEDSLFVNKIILKRMKYGLLSGVHYQYRKRKDQTSAIDTSINRKEFYNETIERFHKAIFEYSKEQYGKIIPYIQYCVMYDLQWRITKKIPQGILNKTEEKEYVKNIADLLKKIGDEVILKQRNIWAEHKLYALSLKNRKVYDQIELKDSKLFYKDMCFCNIRNKSLFKIVIINISNNTIEIRGKINCMLPEKDFKVYYEINGKKRELEYDKNIKMGTRYGINKELYSFYLFTIKEKISRKNKYNIRFYFQYRGELPVEVYLNFEHRAKIATKNRLHYVKDNYILYKEKGSIVVDRYRFSKALQLELYFYLQMLHHLKFKHLFMRTVYHIFKILKHKKIWLISDRISIANDSGLHLFKYATDLKEKDKKIYFVIHKDCEDYNKMKKIGKVIAFNSFKYRLYFLLADKIISSQGDEFLENAFGNSNNYYRDLYRFDFIFLDHGIIKDDLSDWLNIYVKNIRMFVTSALGEYESIIKGKYGFSKDVVKLTGLPRYDNLKNDATKSIAIMPTWRNHLATSPNAETGIRGYYDHFKESDYFKFYDELINDKKLLKAMKKYDYKGIFVVHPSHIANAIDFHGNSLISIVDGHVDYQEIFKTASLLISDYSSVPFDFAYLYKPIIYTQFDKKEFFSSHTYKEGYFSYKKSGFGPVVENYEDTVNMIIKMMEKGCKLDNKYKKRINAFYKYHDRKNCQRVYNEIKKIK